MDKRVVNHVNMSECLFNDVLRMNEIHENDIKNFFDADCVIVFARYKSLLSNVKCNDFVRTIKNQIDCDQLNTPNDIAKDIHEHKIIQRFFRWQMNKQKENGNIKVYSRIIRKDESNE